MSDHVNNDGDQLIRAPAPASPGFGFTRPAPPRRRSPHRAQTKQTCGWWRDTLVMDAIDTKPANSADRAQHLYVPCEGTPLQTAPLKAAAACRRPAATCMQFTCAHIQLRPGAPASFVLAPHEIPQPASYACLVTRLWWSGAVQACSGSTRRTLALDWFQPTSVRQCSSQTLSQTPACVPERALAVGHAIRSE